MMHKFFIPLILAAACGAQAPADLFSRAPKGVDDALRARIGEFYQLQVDGKHRAAEALVADDTKDFYYTATKTKYLSFEIRKIEYNKDFTQAHVTMLLEQFIVAPGFAGKPMKVPVPSEWKLVDGKWYWWIDPEKLRQTPWGALPKDRTPAPANAQAPAINIPTSVEESGIQRTVVVDRTDVSLTKTEGDTIKIKNNANGPVKIVVLEKPRGMEVTVDTPDLKAGSGTAVQFSAGTFDKEHGMVRLAIEPTNQVIEVNVTLK